MDGLKEEPLSEPEQLRLISRLTAPAIRQAVRSARLPRGSYGLDAGCGAGCHLELLAREVGLSGRLTALDISPLNLTAARAMWAETTGTGGLTTGYGGRLTERPVGGLTGGPTGDAAIDFVQGDICRLPFEDEVFDWVWCADTLWPGAVVDDPVPVVAEFKRVTKPGGKVSLLYWSGQTLLPGYPVLEAHLDAAFAEWAPYLAGIRPQSQYLRAQNWLREAGLKRIRARTFLAEINGPFDPGERAALAACYSMFWGDLEGRITTAEWEAYRRLCDPESPGFIADAPGYYAFVTYTLFWGVN